MKNTLIYNIILTFFLASLLIGCTNDTTQVVATDDNSVVNNNNTVIENTPLASTTDEEMTISVPIQEHEIRLVRVKNDQKQAKLSDANVKELESWWDSLPGPMIEAIVIIPKSIVGCCIAPTGE